jgi:peptidyl-prolyl cis-trans isomerase D
MMAAFRAFAKSPWAAGLMGLLILSFGIWGVRDVFHTRISNSVITAGDRKISPSDFKRVFDRRLADLQQQTGQVVSAEDAVRAGADLQILQEMADVEAIQALLYREGVQPSPELVVDQLRKTPAFFNPLTGVFDKQGYQNLLASHQLTPAEYESGLRDQIAADHFSSGMAGGLRAPLTYSALFALLDQEVRNVDFFVMDQKTVGTPPVPSDADLIKFMKDNQAAFRRPEMRALSLVRFSAQALAQGLTADPALVQKQFDFEKAQLSVPERRSFVEIPAKDAGQAAAMAARLGKGEDPSSVARAYGVKPISYPNAAKTAVADPRVADAAFALQPGQVSGPVQGVIGYSVVKLASITPGKPATLDDVRPQIEAKVKEQEAKDKVYDQVQKYDDVHTGGAPMAQAAKAAGVEIYPIGPISADGKLATGQPQSGLNQKMLTDAFSLPQGGETEVIDLGAGEYYAIRVEKIMPSAMRTLDEVRPQLTQYYMTQELVKRLQAKATAVTDQLKKGQTLEAAAASVGATIQHLPGLSRVNAGQQKALGGDFLNRVFQAKPGEAFAAPVPPAGVAIAKVTAVQPGPTPEVAREAVNERPQLSQQMNQGEFSDMLRTAARTVIKPKVDEALARQALGVSPDQVPASSGGKAPQPAP